MEANWLLLLFISIASSITSCESCFKLTHVVTTFQDLITESAITELQSHAQNYSVMLLKDDKLFVGARNHVFQIDVKTFTVQTVLNWSSSVYDVSSCVQGGRPKDECYNFIQVLQPFRGRLLICGTNSYDPTCKWKNLTDLSTPSKTDSEGNFYGDGEIDGVGLVPYSPKFFSTGVISEKGRYYAGTMLDGGARIPTIFSMDFKRPNRILETSRGDKNWLSDSEFVKSFNIGKYVYFFFREEAIENDYKKTRVPTVARICKGDHGGSRYSLKKNFVTFNKARLSCSTKGEYPMYFNDIQDVFWDEKVSLFYAVFTTEPDGVDVSAVCSYSQQEIERVFNGDYKFYDTSSRQWVSRTNKHHFENCTVKASSQVPMSDRDKKKYVPDGMMATSIMTREAFTDSKNYQLMNEIVQPRTSTALYIKQGQRFKNIAVDFVNNRMVMYIGTEKGSILKLFDPDGNKTTCIIEEINIFDEGQQGHINKMLLNSQQGVLYVTTSSKVVKIQLDRCSKHKDRDSCIQARDPYCGWSSGGCTSWKARGKIWEQKLDQCPLPQAKWSPWSSWQLCTQQDDNVCRCRKRECLNTCNPRDCQGEPIELKNCTVNKQTWWTSEADWIKEGVIHGNWTHWAKWTTCSVTLGAGVKKRYRFCNAPHPKNGGQNCIGDKTQFAECFVKQPLNTLKREIWTQYTGVLGKKDTATRQRYTCSVSGHDLSNMSLTLSKTEYVDCQQDRRLCKIPPTTPPGLWSKWAKWSTCVVVGMQYRTRTCKDEDKPCLGDRRQDRQCYPIPKVTSPTSPTTPTEEPVIRRTSPTEPDIDTSWSTWSKCICDLPFKITPENNSPEPIGVQHRFRRCRELHPNDGRCPEDRVEYKTCECEKQDNFEYTKHDKADRTSKKTGYRIGDVIGAAIVTGVLVLVICAIMAYILVRRRQNFDVSKAFEKSMREDADDSKYEQSNGVEYPSESSKDRNSRARLQPVVLKPKGRKSFKDLFKKSETPEAV